MGPQPAHAPGERNCLTNLPTDLLVRRETRSAAPPNVPPPCAPATRLARDVHRTRTRARPPRVFPRAFGPVGPLFGSATVPATLSTSPSRTLHPASTRLTRVVSQMKIVCSLRHDELQPLLATCSRLRQAAAAAITVYFNFVTPEPTAAGEAAVAVRAPA